METDQLTNRQSEIQKEITWEEVSKHSTPTDLWIVVENNVFSVGAYDEHPGGPVVLQNRGGKDATKQFLDAGHTNEARTKMKPFLIGKIKDGDIPLEGQVEPEFKMNIKAIVIIIVLITIIGLYIVFI